MNQEKICFLIKYNQFIIFIKLLNESKISSINFTDGDFVWELKEKEFIINIEDLKILLKNGSLNIETNLKNEIKFELSKQFFTLACVPDCLARQQIKELLFNLANENSVNENKLINAENKVLHLETNRPSNIFFGPTDKKRKIKKIVPNTNLLANKKQRGITYDSD